MRPTLTLLILMILGNLASANEYDILIKNGSIYDGSGQIPYIADIAINDDRIVAIGALKEEHAASVIDATGLAVTPGFFNMLSHAHLSLLKDGRAISDVVQGVTFEVLSEISLSPITPTTAAMLGALFGESALDITWSSLDEYLKTVQRHGISPNVATFVSAGTVRMNIIGTNDTAPSPDQMKAMKSQVREAMQDGALGLTTALIYAPSSFATTEELIELAKVASEHGGIYTAHIRSEANQVHDAIDETLMIGKEANIPVHIHHLKTAGQPNWQKLEDIIRQINTERAKGASITADMYTYVAGSSGLSAAMPTWVQAGGLEMWIKRLNDADIRARVKAEMATNANDWENLGYLATPEGMILVDFQNSDLKKYAGKSLRHVADERQQDPRDTIIDLVIQDKSRVGTMYFLMSEDNVRRQLNQPWIMFGSDAITASAQGSDLKKPVHPRTYGNVARLLGKYVQKEGVLPLEEAVRRLTSLPAKTLGISDRGILEPGYFADIVIFDPTSVKDKATFEQPHQLATGMEYVLVNGTLVVEQGQHTGAKPGRTIRGPGWTKHNINQSHESSAP